MACNNYGCSAIDSSTSAELIGTPPTISPPGDTGPIGTQEPEGTSVSPVGVAPAPDLVLDPPTVSSASPPVGSSFTVSATVRNQGDGLAGSTVLRYYRSGNPTITTADTEVGAEAVGALDATERAAGSVTLTAPDTPGTYYYGACVAEVPGESDTTNNCSSAVTVTVAALSLPDTVVDPPTVNNPSPPVGSSFTLGTAVRNQGTKASSATTLRYYRSNDPTITTADTAVEDEPVPALDALQSADRSVDLTAPDTPGTYYYGACVATVAGEADTANNCSTAVTVTAGAAPAPGLVVDPPTVSVPAPAAGTSFTLTATVRNQGNGPAGPTALRYYQSTDPTITTDDTAVGTDPVPTLDAAGSAGGSLSLTAPDTPGTYYYGACVDAVAGEADTTNNCSTAIAVTVGPAPAPDLAVDTPTVSNITPPAGEPLTVKTTVRNQGNGPSGATTLRFYQSTDPTITTGDTAVGTEALPGLRTSQSTGGSARLATPSTPGTYYYGACVDAVANEADTTNNCSAAIAVTVGPAPAPDVVVGTPTVSSASPPEGSSFTLGATVRNRGNGPAGPTALRYYQSTDPTITTDDTAVGTDPIPALVAAGSTAGSVSLTAPDTPGTYHYGACVDAVPGEADTTNNCSAAITVTVGAAPAPGLVVDPPTVSESAPTVGASFTLDVTVRNQGDGASGATTLRYYRSTDSTITTDDTAVGTDPIPALGASASAGGSVSLTAPDTPGTYYYGACVDPVSGEADTTNNCSAAVTVTVTAPDLAVDPPMVTETTPVAGTSFTLTATVRNQGNSASGSTTLHYYQSSDSTITTADTSVGTDTVGGLSVSEGDTESISLTAPATPGTYYYGACVDAVAGEADTTNNCSIAVTVTVVAASAPDLVVDSPTMSTSGRTIAGAVPVGATVTARVTVRDQGDSESGPAILRYYRSTDSDHHDRAMHFA